MNAEKTDKATNDFHPRPSCGSVSKVLRSTADVGAEIPRVTGYRPRQSKPAARRGIISVLAFAAETVRDRTDQG